MVFVKLQFTSGGSPVKKTAVNWSFSSPVSQPILNLFSRNLTYSSQTDDKGFVYLYLMPSSVLQNYGVIPSTYHIQCSGFSKTFELYVPDFSQQDFTQVFDVSNSPIPPVVTPNYTDGIVSSTWLSGDMPPSSQMGFNGDFYIEDDSKIWYKSSNSWRMVSTFSTKVDTSLITKIATMPTGGHRLVSRCGEDIIYASYDHLESVDYVLGLSLNSALEGEEITIKTSGLITEPSWDFVEGTTLFLGTNGNLVTQAPQSGFLLKVAKAMSKDTILLSIETTTQIS